MSSDERRELTLMIDGKEHPVVEIDYSTLHIAMAYSGSGKRKPRGDQHSIKGFDRCLVKLASTFSSMPLPAIRHAVPSPVN
jgi:hypothetical protein